MEIDGDHLRRWILSRVFQTQLSVADVIDQIDREDTIEPEIVRCKDCRNYDMAQNNVNGICNHLGVPMDVYEWCSRGERKI